MLAFSARLIRLWLLIAPMLRDDLPATMRPIEWDRFECFPARLRLVQIDATSWRVEPSITFTCAVRA